ncbi:MAG: GNAT family N-acetyltransferase [Oligoflexus sp.]|nr:GNAT family N-acetyltransferase [Oligoflexus sp.]
MNTNLSFRLRRALPEDNEKLIDLARRCPMLGQLEMHSDRFPDFFAINELQGELSHVYLAETDVGDIIGCAAFTEKTIMKNGFPVKILHFGDLRSDPTARRSSIAAEMVKIYLDMLRAGSFDHGYFEILEGNNAVIKLHRLLTDEFQW